MADHDPLPGHIHSLSLDEPPVHSLTSPPPSASTSHGFSHNDEAREDDTTAEEDGAPSDERGRAADEADEDPADGQRAADDDDPAQQHDDEGAFEAVSLDDGNNASTRAHEPAHSTHTRSSSSPSPVPTSTPPFSPTVTATPATTAADPSASNISVPSSGALDTPHEAGENADSPAPAEAATASLAPPTESPPAVNPADAAQKKPVSTKAPTMMQKVISFTRQRDLPPKSKEEEEKHLKQLAEMHAASKEAEKRRQSEVEARSAARQASLAAAFPAWEQSILPNWRVVLHDDSAGRRLRQLWWDGTMPVRWRGRLWGMAIGNGLAVPKTAFAQAQTRVRKAVEEGRLEEVRKEAEEDVERTLPTLKLFQRGGVMHEELMDLLLAWSTYEKIKPRYPRGLAYPAALLLVNMPASEAFISLVNLVQKSVLRSFYGDDPEEEDAYYRVFDTLLADFMPKVYANFSSQVVRPSLYLKPWLSTLYVHFLPLDLSTRLFDVFLLEGDSFLFRVALVLLELLEPRLFNPNLDELAAVFSGQDRGAVAVVRREKGLLTPDGGALDEKDEVRVEVEDVYTEMGCVEDRIFARLQGMDWKEETWTRLIERELPEAI
ncbi:hypothetical protein JCM10207_003040 [Rhodosporidiobolus poonsookiae]